MRPALLCKYSLSILLLSMCSTIVIAQLQFPGAPLGINSQLIAAEVMYVLPPADPMEIEAQLEQNRMTNSKPLRFALERPVNLSPESHGSWSQIGDVRLWHVHVLSPGAHSLGLVFGRYALLPGVKLFVYNPDQQSIKGAFTSQNNKASGIFPVGHIPGDELIIELQLPAGVTDYGELELEALSHAFLSTGFKSTADDCPAGEFGCSQQCEVDINCLEGDPWWQVKPSVVRVFTTNFYCTGVLVNNTAYDGTPYVITAEHCLNNQYYGDRTIIQFNYESATCFGENGPLDMSLEGAIIRSHGDSVDFSLVELVHTPPASYGAYYAGWDRSDLQVNSTVTIHHPFGDVKKISIDEEAPFIPEQPGDVPYSGLEDYHYYSYWWVKRWETGTTEGGSSGGPLFNQARKVIGNLSGGNAACGDSIGYDADTDRVIYNSAPNYDDYFTRFGMAWDHEEAKGNGLKPWLDPLNLDPVSLGGYNPTSTEPVNVVTGDRYHVFPNPAVDLFHITSREPVQGKVHYTLISLTGKLLERGQLDEEGRAEVQLSSLVPGLYIVRVGNAAYQEHHKLLVSGR